MAEKLLGVNVLVSVGGVVLGSQRNASLKIDAKEIDVSDKTTGGWDTTLVGNRKWSIDCDCIALDSDLGQAALESAAMDGTKVTVAFDHAGRRTFSGEAVVQSFELTGEKDDVSTAKVTFKGSSALA